jgi:hypothetical protein
MAPVRRVEAPSVEPADPLTDHVLTDNFFPLRGRLAHRDEGA